MPDLPLHYTSAGRGPALVLLHPVGLDNTFWGPLVERASRTRTVVAVDLAGHGKSPAVSGDRGIAAYASDVRALIETLDIHRPAVLGLSFGGMIAQELATTHPACVSRLIVGACGARISQEARPAVRARGTAALGSQGMGAVVDETLQRWFTGPFLTAPAVETVRRRLLADDPQGWASGWAAIAGFDVLDRLPHLAIPVLAVAASEDAGTPVEGTRAIATAVPGARFTVIEGAPHMMQIECAEAFCDAVSGFLAVDAA